MLHRNWQWWQYTICRSLMFELRSFGYCDNNAFGACYTLPLNGVQVQRMYLGLKFSYTVIVWLLKASSLAPVWMQERLPIPESPNYYSIIPEEHYKCMGKTAVFVHVSKLLLFRI